MLEKLIKKITLFLGFANAIEPDVNGVYSLFFEPKTTVFVSEGVEKDILLKSILGETKQEEDNSKLYLRLMAASLFGLETGGAILGLDNKNVVLLKKISADISYEDFQDYLEMFINFSESWQNDLALSLNSNKKEI